MLSAHDLSALGLVASTAGRMAQYPGSGESMESRSRRGMEERVREDAPCREPDANPNPAHRRQVIRARVPHTNYNKLLKQN